MGSTLKKTLPIVIVALLGWLIWKYLKPQIYNIEIPETFAQNELFEEAFEFTYHNYKHTFDSITVSDGLELTEVAAVAKIHFKDKNPHPLQTASYWKNGYRYMQVFTRRSIWADDTCCSAGGNVLSALGFYEKEAVGIFQQNYEGSEIVLQLEKKKPEKIIALWENFAISGETDGEQVKIKIPKCAVKFKTSMIRVWCSDGVTVSPVCEIPLANGQVPTRFTQVASLRDDARFGALQPMFWELADSQMSDWVMAALSDVCEDNELKLAVAFGDLRAMQNGDYTAVVSNYFGKKVVVVFNTSNAEKNIQLPVKGDLKHSYSNRPFRYKGNRINLVLPARSYEIIW